MAGLIIATVFINKVWRLWRPHGRAVWSVCSCFRKCYSNRWFTLKPTIRSSNSSYVHDAQGMLQAVGIGPATAVLVSEGRWGCMARSALPHHMSVPMIWLLLFCVQLLLTASKELHKQQSTTEPAEVNLQLSLWTWQQL